jgi:hypothetical protein
MEHTTDWKLGYAESALRRILDIIDNEINPNKLDTNSKAMIDKLYGVAERALGEIK